MPGRSTRHRTDPFAGFDADAPAIAVPEAFFLQILPRITALEELHVTLAIFRILASMRDRSLPIAEDVIARDRDLRYALREEGSPSEADRRISLGLDLALARGTFLRFVAIRPRSESYWYYLNTAANRAHLDAMTRGIVEPPEIVWKGRTAPSIAVDTPNAFRLYEQNIGPLTPMLADQISQAIADYPADWIEDAIEEAVTYNRRSWRYISRILENWTTQGRSDASAQS
jgi:DnaD/phage-associated family protein